MTNLNLHQMCNLMGIQLTEVNSNGSYTRTHYENNISGKPVTVESIPVPVPTSAPVPMSVPVPESISTSSAPAPVPVNYGFYINDRKYSFTHWIMSRKKKYETRTRRTLDHLIGKRVAIIRTGHGKSVIIGYVTVGEPFYTDDEFLRRSAMIYNTEYDTTYTKSGKKWFYPMINPVICNLYNVPENAVRHGYTWVEWEV